MSYNKPHFCNNCGKYGHSYHQCKLPIISSGIILVTYVNQKYYYLMIRRKDTLGYVDFLRGRYNETNEYHLQNIINEMTNKEKQNLLHKNFTLLWNDLWSITNTNHSQYKQEEKHSKKKLEQLKENNILTRVINNSHSTWHEPEWGFPKGRRNYLERDIDCAVREFEEETGIKKEDITIVYNIIPYEEIFMGSNFKSYKHKYFIAFKKINDISIPTNFQKTEVSKLGWFTYEECLNKIRPYNLEKKNIITKINNVLNNYSIYK